MGNYSSAYVAGTTRFRAEDLNPPIAGLDKALTYIKNVMIGCDGQVTYNPSTGVLAWSNAIHIYYNRTDGQAIHNSIAAGNVTLTDSKFAYVTLSEANNTALTMNSGTISTGSASNFLAYNLLVLGYRNASDDNFYGLLWPLVLRSVYVEKNLFDAYTVLYADTDNSPAALTVSANTIVGRRNSGGIVAISLADHKTDLGLSSSDSPKFTGIGVAGSTGGYIRKRAEATANITASSSVTITLSIPTGARLLGAQLRVDAALVTGELWDAAYSGGSSTSLASGAAVAKNTKVNKMHAPEITTATTNIAITKNGGGDFTAQGTIRAIVYYEDFEAMGDAA